MISAGLSDRRDLLDAGADPNAKQEGGYVPLRAAAQNGDAAMAELLLARGAVPDARTDKGETAADFAAAAGNDELAQRLTV